VNPVAATDTKGRVWVAWQGFRNNNLEILAAAQQGDGFTADPPFWPSRFAVLEIRFNIWIALHLGQV
jgi:hypothetical protein